MMKIDDIVELEIIDDSINGDGIAKLDSRIVFVPYTAKGDKVKAKIIKINKSEVVARVIKLIEASSYRREVDCSIYRVCGGCCLLHLDYMHQLEIKKRQVENNLYKIAKINKKVDKVVASNQFHYRNKIQLPIGQNDKGEIIVGYFKKNTHEIIEQGTCLLSKKEHEKVIDIFLEFANFEKLSVYNESTGKGLLRHIMVRQLGRIIYVTLVINGDNIQNLNKLYDRFIKAGISGIAINLCINKKKTNVILDGEIKTVYGDDAEKATILDADIVASQKSFMQVNSDVRNVLYKDAINLILEKKVNQLVECFSGVGVMTNVLAKNVNKVYTIEIEKKAVKDANYNKTVNANFNITNILGDANIEINKLSTQLDSFSLLVDPPRKGLMDSFIKNIIETKPENIFYISCDSATLARDICLLKGYEIQQLNIYDMFPNTQHVECIALIQRVKS